MDEWLEKYFDMFGEGFPTFQIARGRTDDECIEIIKTCIENKKDAYELGYAEDDEDTIY